MLEFKVFENLKPNKDLNGILKNFKYKVKLGQIKTILHTNLQVIIPTEYKIIYPTTLTILEYKVNEISNKPFYIKEYNQKYNIKEIAYFLKNFNFRLYFLLICEETYERYILIFFGNLRKGEKIYEMWNLCKSIN